MGEHELTVGKVALDRIARGPFARQQLLGQRILNEALDGTAQRTSAIGKVCAPRAMYSKKKLL